MSLKEKWVVSFGAVIVGGALLFLGILRELEALTAIAVALLTAGLALNFLWWRCPHCGVTLGRNYGRYCQYCGEEIDYNARPKKS